MDELINNGVKNVGISHEKKSKTFIDHSQSTNNVYENLQDCNQANKKVLIVFGDKIADIEANKKIPNKREL